MANGVSEVIVATDIAKGDFFRGYEKNYPSSGNGGNKNSRNIIIVTTAIRYAGNKDEVLHLYI